MNADANARTAALDILRAVRSGAQFDIALAAIDPDVQPADRRLAHEIAAGVLRERRLLDHRIATALARPDKGIRGELSDILRIGAYQLSHLDRVPDYAAVQTTVDLAKRACGSKTAPLVNAVLRRIAREDWTAPTDADGLGMAYSHPDWLVNRWIRTFGRERTRLLLVHNNTQPTITLQPARWSASRLAEALESNGVNVARRQAGGPAYGFELQDHRQVSSLPGYDEGAFVVQDSSQRRLLEFAAFPADIMIWDACAAPGGKAVTLAARGPVVASDPSPSRLKRLRENVDRVAPSVRLFRADARQPPLAGGSMRGVLVDAPCSATGTIARHPDARWRVSARRIRTLCRLQAEILDGAAGIVAPRGLLVYFTCSLEPEENHMQVDQFLERHTAFERDGDDVLIFPPDHRSDGGFGARLRRAA